ncbi:DEAD-box ATP-dependent RNA helicase 21-like [Rhododendron vialii]|uniref:DEAD-box ATP-dependent RNA helicase 21-like n=1 Tax=Rhododendron vialii TaxID=182163 RepID=UPI00266043E2|nr:DEAD-box ATP-dependent RNA helicase 21-like [Rhododendron vialii]XP_058201370.1 DEAD-box ATP-dependent RNA helicase 21-like [Rhododendron vialii]
MKPVFVPRSTRQRKEEEFATRAEEERDDHRDSKRRTMRRRNHGERDQKDGERRERVEEKLVAERHKSQTEHHHLQKAMPPIKEQQQQIIIPPKKRVMAKPGRFSFDWDNTDDTSSRVDHLEEAPLLFGRGYLAGIDRPEQRKRKKLFDFDLRHWSEKKVEEMKERDWRIFREDFNISYKGGGSKIPRPMRSWDESGLTPQLLRAVERAGYHNPTPIQIAAIPLGLQQRDVIGIAQTGSGKTAAFILPMLNYIVASRGFMKNTRELENDEAEAEEGPYAVVMVPTRELAQQIEDETIKLSHYLSGIKVVSIVGGQSIEEQGFRIRQGCDVVIATPGRLIDCLHRRYIVLNRCNYVVLDESDRMTDEGFEPQIAGVLDAMPSTNLKPKNQDEELDEKKIYRTTYMFSATMPPAVERLARKYLRNPVVVTVGSAGNLITQHVIMMNSSEKLHLLEKLLDQLGGDKTAIVFVNTKRCADTLSRALDKAGYRLTTFHGDKSQEQRELSLEGFRAKRNNVLVATDVAGRGIDIPDVAHVINYDMPDKIEKYTHRIGRTGRAGKTGVATTFLTLHDADVFYDLRQMLIQSKSPVPSELARHKASKFKPGTNYS